MTRAGLGCNPNDGGTRVRTRAGLGCKPNDGGTRVRTRAGLARNPNDGGIDVRHRDRVGHEIAVFLADVLLKELSQKRVVVVERCGPDP